jgi:hypothetical protein
MSKVSARSSDQKVTRTRWLAATYTRQLLDRSAGLKRNPRAAACFGGAHPAGMSGLITALNIAYEEPEKRGFSN